MAGAKAVCFVVASFVVLTPLILNAQGPALAPIRSTELVARFPRSHLIDNELP